MQKKESPAGKLRAKKKLRPKKKGRGHPYTRALLMKLHHSKELLTKRKSPEGYLVHSKEEE